MKDLANLFDSNTVSLLVSLGALIISIIALIYTIRTFLLKSGLKIRCNITTASTVDSEDKYVSSITLENIKDRATVIFKIYLQLGNNNFVEIEDFSNNPLILKPFEVYHKEYDPVLFYSSNNYKIKIDHLIDNYKIKRGIILSTTDGKYKVKTYISGWDAVITSLKNFYTLTIHPKRLVYKNKSYGSNIRYLIDIKFNDDYQEVIPIRRGEELRKIFKNFDITKSSIESNLSLEKFLHKQKKDGKLTFIDLKVIDYSEGIQKGQDFYKPEPIAAETMGLLKYLFIGKIHTIYEDYKLKKQNKKLHSTRTIKVI